MILEAESRIKLPKGALPPDPWMGDGTELHLDHVVARNNKGEVVSRAGDLVWDLTSYHAHGQTTRLYFDYWQNKANRKINESEITPQRLMRIRELQHLMCNIMYSKSYTGIGVSSLHHIQYMSRKIALYAEEADCGVGEVLRRAELLDKFIGKIRNKDAMHLRNLLNSLYAQNSDEAAFPVARTTFWDKLSLLAIKHQESIKQHAPLPTRIYSEWINNLDAELTFIESHLDKLISTLRGAVKAWRDADAKRTGTRGVVVGPDLLGETSLGDLFDRYGKNRELNGLSSVVHAVYLVCKQQIHTFSAMRDKEVIYLPFDCMKTEGRNGRKYALIEGYTTKLNGGRKRRAQWVTTEESGFRAIRIAQKLSSVIYESIGIKPSKKDDDKDIFRLFISTNYLPWNNSQGFDTSGSVPFRVVTNLRVSTKYYESLVARLIPVIKEEDVAELEDIDPFRNWHDEEEFQVGRIWPLRSHQLRRSLALYARASGCVRLSSLRRQLQHISNDMSSYYANGSTFAKNFFIEDPKGFNKHVVKEWQETEEEAELLSFVWDVLKSEEPLYGGAGNFYDTQRQKGKLMTREQVQVAIKSGTMAYKSGPIGGCTKLGPCEKRTGIALVNTVCATKGCKNLVGKHSKIIQVIKAKRGMLAHISPDTITHRVESEDLQALEQVEALWRPVGVPETHSTGVGHG
ncbi:MAG: hypothetical protein WCT35_07380 [Sideroxydans sp.]|jgi:hypothetical protein